MKRLIMAAVLMVVMAGQAWAVDYSGIYVDKKNGGDIEIKKNGNPNDEYSVKITVVPPGITRIGEVSFAGFFDGGKINYVEKGCSLALSATGNRIISVKQDSSAGNCDAGMDVYFNGLYKRQKPKNK